MTTKKKTAGDPLVAASDILIDGKAFEAGKVITGVDADQIAIAESQRRVVKKSVYDKLAAGVPGPDLGQPESEADESEVDEGEADEGDTDEGAAEGEGDAEGDNGGSDQ